MIFLSSGTKPDVLIVTNMWPRDDNPVYGIFVKRQIDSLKSLGLSCDVLFVEGYRTRWEYGRAALAVLRLTWSRRHPAIIHAHGGETALAVCWYRSRSVIVSYCGDDLLGTPRSDGSLLYTSRVRRLVLRNLARVVSATITKSAEMEATLPWSVRARNTVIPNGVDRSVFFPASRDESRSQLGWRASERVVLFAADPAVERKRYWLAEAACREAAKVTGAVRLEVATGVTPSMLPRLMRGADCLLLPSVLEGSPNVVKEAMACNLPVICTDVGDVRQVLAGVEPSWICGADAIELGNALVDCLTERPRSNGWEQSAWLDQDEIALRLLEVYRRLSPELADVIPPSARPACAGVLTLASNPYKAGQRPVPPVDESPLPQLKQQNAHKLLIGLDSIRSGSIRRTTAPGRNCRRPIVWSLSSISSGEALEPGRVRRPRGGGRPLSEPDPTLLYDLGQLVEADTRGDAKQSLLWTSKSARKLAAELRACGDEVHFITVGLQAVAQPAQQFGDTKQGSRHPGRDVEFRHVNAAGAADGHRSATTEWSAARRCHQRLRSDPVATLRFDHLVVAPACCVASCRRAEKDARRGACSGM